MNRSWQPITAARAAEQGRRSRRAAVALIGEHDTLANKTDP
jgi:hypothetical protein